MIKIVLADDHQMVIEGLEKILNEHKEEVSIVGTANGGKELLDIVSEKKGTIDVAILDISMPGMEEESWETVRSLRDNYPTIKILILTMHLKGNYIAELYDLGIKGYVVKNRSAKELIEAIKLVHQGKSYSSNGVSEAYLEEKTNQEKRNSVKVLITKREREVLKILAEEDLTAKEIADKLHIAKSTVDTHKKNLMKKIGTNSDKGLVSFAIKNDLN